MSPNHYLAAAIAYLYGGARPDWPATAGVGKTMVSSSIIDRVVAGLHRGLEEVPVGFKWFVSGLLDGTLGFGGEESAGASFLRHDGTAWTTDKDGLIMCLLAAEMTSAAARIPVSSTTSSPGAMATRSTAASTRPPPPNRSLRWGRSPADLTATELAGEPIVQVLTAAPSGAPLGGVKVVTENAWFAARPSGTEDVCKLYAESFKGEPHLDKVLEQAQELLEGALVN